MNIHVWTWAGRTYIVGAAFLFFVTMLLASQIVNAGCPILVFFFIRHFNLYKLPLLKLIGTQHFLCDIERRSLVYPFIFYFL